MKKKFLVLGNAAAKIGAFALVLGLVACDDSTSANGSFGDENPAEVSSSSILTTSSPTEDPGSSSSSVILNGGSAGVEGSSSSVTSSSSVESSSSVVSSSSEKSSSSVASSSSVKSSSSVVVVKGSMTDTRDGQVYKTVTIGTQTWMAENLNYRYVGVKYDYDGYTSDSTSWCNGNMASNCDKYGRLYTWSAVMDSAAQFSVNAGTKCGYGKTCTPNSPHRGICPEGWHVPTNEEYSTLYTYVGGTSKAGQKLKANTSLWFYNTGTDEYGFSVLPAGVWYYKGIFRNEGYYANLWSASDYNSYYAWYQRFLYDGGYVYQEYFGNKYYGRSLRCLKD